MNWREIVIGGLLLPLELYFQPNRFKKRVHALAPRLNEFYSLWQARKYWKSADFLQGIATLYLQALVSFIWVMIILSVWAGLGVEVNLSFVLLSIMSSVALGIIISLAKGLAFSVLLNIASAFAFTFGGEIASLAITITLGLTFNIIGSASQSRWFIFSFAIITSTAPVLGSLIQRLELNLTSSLIIAGISLIIILHLWLSPLWVMLHRLQLRRIRSNPSAIASTWRWHPVNLDEIIFPRLSGLDELLKAYFKHDAQAGIKVINQMARHPTQNWEPRALQKLLVQNIGESAQTIGEIAAFHQHELVNSMIDFSLSKEEREDLANLRHVSLWVKMALTDELPSHRLKRLKQTLRLLNSVLLKSSNFQMTVKQWHQIFIQTLEQIKHERLQIEQLPNPYQYLDNSFYLYPDEPPEYLTFKGRESLFQQIENLIDDQSKNFLLIGQNYSGKTAALYQLNQCLRSKASVVFFDKFFGDWHDLNLILGNLAKQICEQVQRDYQIQIPPLTIKDTPDRDLEAWFDQLEVIFPYHVLVCLDDHIDFSETLLDDHLDQRFLAVVATEPRRKIKFLFSTSQEIDELPDAWANALINTVKLRISFLEHADTVELIRHPIREFPDIYTDDAVSHIIQWTHCQPYLVQLTCSILVDRMNRARRMPPESSVTVEDVEAVIPMIFERGKNYFYDQYRAQSGGPAGQALLDQMARSPQWTLTRAEMSAIVPDESELRRTIRTMTRREMIHMVGDDRYQITVPLFARYVAQVSG